MSIDVQQVIYALERAATFQQRQADTLHVARDYSAELWAEDAERLREAITLLQPLLQVDQRPSPTAPVGEAIDGRAYRRITARR